MSARWVTLRWEQWACRHLKFPFAYPPVWGGLGEAHQLLRDLALTQAEPVQQAEDDDRDDGDLVLATLQVREKLAEELAADDRDVGDRADVDKKVVEPAGEADEIAVGAPEKNVAAARFREHRAELGVNVRPHQRPHRAEREDADDEPLAAEIRGQDPGRLDDRSADHGPDNDRDAEPDPEDPEQMIGRQISSVPRRERIVHWGLGFWFWVLGLWFWGFGFGFLALGLVSGRKSKVQDPKPNTQNLMPKT